MNMLTINTLLTPITRLGLIFAGLLVAGLCQATPVFFNVPNAYSKPGENVQVALNEARDNLESAPIEGALIKVNYDPLFLEFNSEYDTLFLKSTNEYVRIYTNPTPGELAVADYFTVMPGIPYADGSQMAVNVSLAGDPWKLLDLIQLDPIKSTYAILALKFKILERTPPLGFTSVSFVSINTDYDVPETTGKVYITAQAVPEPASILLLLAGLLLMLYRVYGEEEKRSAG
jgi:hypothetical protein